MADPCLKTREAFPISKRGDNESMGGRSTIDRTYGDYVRKTREQRKFRCYLYLFRLQEPNWESYRAPRRGSSWRQREDRVCGTLQFLPERLLPILVHPM
jgi:hypothetical protein